MKSNPISKKFMRTSYNFNTGVTKSVKEWVAECPRCGKILTAGRTMGIYGIAENSRKTAKDKLFFHLKFTHHN